VSAKGSGGSWGAARDMLASIAAIGPMIEGEA